MKCLEIARLQDFTPNTPELLGALSLCNPPLEIPVYGPETWYKVLYQHTMYIISLSNISVVIKEWCDVARDVICRTTYHWNVRENTVTWYRWMNDKLTWRHARNVVSLRILYKFYFNPCYMFKIPFYWNVR
jgi:hypothetical protein